MARRSKIFRANPQVLDPIKIEICTAIETVMARRQWTQAQAAIYMGTSQSNISNIANKRLNKLSIGQLMNYLALICPEFRFMISVDASLGHAERA